MKNQMSVQQQAILNMDFTNIENHCFSGMEELDYGPGFGYDRVYESPAMKVLGLRLQANIDGITRISYGTWMIIFICYIYDGHGSIQHRFELYSRVYSESYIDAWTPDNSDDFRDRDAYDMLFSQLDEEKLYEECMEYVENRGLEEQEYLSDKYNL